MKLLITLLIFFSISQCLGQSSLSGKVTDEKGILLTGASIYYKGTYTGTSSNELGQFKLESDLTDSVWVICEFIGFQSDSLHIDLSKSLFNVHFQLKESLEFLEGVTIVASSFEAGDEKRGTTLTPLEIASTAGALGDIVGAINTLPGATRVGESGRLFVRGGDSRESNTYIDGSLVQVPFHTASPNLATRGRFNPFLFKGTVFNTGGYSAEFGQALSSVLLLNTNDIKESNEVNFSILTLGADVTATKNWKTGSITGSASYINLSPYLAVARSNANFPKAPRFYSNEISVKQKAGKNGLFKLYTNINQARSEISQNNLDSPGNELKTGINNTNLFLNTSYQNAWAKKWNSIHAIATVRNKDVFNIDGSILERNTKGVHLKNKFSHELNQSIDLNFGFDQFFNQTTFEAGTEQNDITKNLYASFVEAQITTSTKFVLKPGFRYEYSAVLKEVNWMPRFSAAYVVDQFSQWSFAYGKFYQEPSDEFLLQERNLTSESAEHFIFSFQKDKNQRLFRSEIYYKNYESLVKFNPNETIQDFTSLTNDGDGFAYGIDLFYRDRSTIKNGSFWLSYGYLITERDYLNFPSRATPSFASKHNFSFVYKQWISSLKSQLGVDYSYSSPRFFNDPNEEAFNTGKIKAYQQVNISWAYLHRSNFIFYTTMTNVLGNQQEFGRRFASQANDQGDFRSEKIVPFARRFFVLGMFYTISKDKSKNQLDKIN